MMAESKDNDSDRDATRGGLPPLPGVATPPKPGTRADSETRIGGGLPPLPAGPPPASAAGSVQPSTTVEPVAADDEAKTVIAGEELEATVFVARSPFSLMHLKPAGHTLPITLTESRYLLGRSRSCNIQLFSPTAHRKHAQLVRSGDAWLLEPIENSVVLANGDLVRGRVELAHKMRIQLGDDELMFFDERKAGLEPAAVQSVPAGRWKTVAGVSIAVAFIATALLWWSSWR